MPPERSRGMIQSRKLSPRTSSSRLMSDSNRGMSSWRCSQLSGWRSRLCRCRYRSSGPVRVAAVSPGISVPTALPARCAAETTRWPRVGSGCEVTFCFGISVSTPAGTPRNAQIRSRVRAGSSTICR